MSSISKFFKQFDRVICLSLPSCIERRQYMENFKSQYKISNFEFFNAVGATSDQVVDFYKADLVKKFPSCFRCKKLVCGNDDCNNTLIPSQVATFLTYANLWQYMKDNKINNALIVEDDIVLVQQAERLCDEVLNNHTLAKSELFDYKPMLVRFGWALSSEHTSLDEVSLYFNKVRMSNPVHAINLEMASYLLKGFKKVETTVDVYQHKMMANESNSITVYPPLFYEMSWSTGEVESLIHPKLVRLDFLSNNSQDHTPEYEIAKNKLEQHCKHTSVYPILALGHPRCGSGYTAKLLTVFGLDVGHEKMGYDGICSWMFAVDDDYPFALNDEAANKRFKYFKHIIHHVRSPIDAIPSIMRDSEFSNLSHQFRRKHIKSAFNIDIDDFNNPLASAIASYVYWNLLIEKIEPQCRVRVEDQQEHLHQYLLDNLLISKLNLSEAEMPTADINKDKKYKGVVYRKPFIEEQDFNSVPKHLMEKLNALCSRYGYSNFPTIEKKLMTNESSVTNELDRFTKLTLKPQGWCESVKQQVPVDVSGDALPWWTYPSIEFMETVISQNTRVFEFGCGNSSLWWQKRVFQVVSVDHDLEWVNKILPNINRPHHLYHKGSGIQSSLEGQKIYQQYADRRPRGEFDYDDDKITRRGLNDIDFIGYAESILAQPGYFDCIVIDGMARRLCAHFAVKKLAKNGIIIFDNSNRSDYIEGYQYLVEEGFYQIRLSGAVAGAAFPSCTSIFIKSIESLPKVVFKKPLFDIPEY
ncbi:glycosyltransferase family 25 protein [Thalassotalea psychrophila]|uniref:Glycosyltransferase family 25 protein n=1 Tax=Thalassotalea psychrophila TaxID=3065647 RepID=A0ABY9TR64_9GAMM|nr:glycosyltransferase family 25 protein [Colwelliaceae bacterium SQ149]